MQRENMPRTARVPADFAEAINHLLSEMTLEEKVGQVTMVENNSIEPAQVAEFCIGSVLSGGGGNPTPNSPSDWREMVLGFQQAALQTRLGIPLIYAVDAVHGHNNVKGTVIFPHNIGLGATQDPDLVERIGRITAREMLATSVQWTFAPSVSVPQDLRWGRTYEGYSDNTQLVAELGAALVRGLQNGPDDQRVLACAKHYVADGATKWREIPTTQDLMQQGSTAPPQAAAPAGRTRSDARAMADRSGNLRYRRNNAARKPSAALRRCDRRWRVKRHGILQHLGRNEIARASLPFDRCAQGRIRLRWSGRDRLDGDQSDRQRLQRLCRHRG